MFLRAKNSMKGKCCAFGNYKQRKKVCLVYLKCKLRQVQYDSPIFKLNCQKTVEKTYLETRKEEKRYC